jgi:adenosylcobyric acid synthase
MTGALMFQGTGSDVGKTVMVAGLCRAARNRGLRALPFKPQNMSNNAAVAEPDENGLSGEIGRAQWLQALACGAAPSVHMNPVLLKPQAENGSQVVVHGRVRGTVTARDYQKLKPQLLDAVLASYRWLRSRADIVIVEGAGSPAEINLRDGDIANMGFAVKAGVPVILVGDIDRGGVLAAIVGTHALLDPCDRAAVKGYMINKFRGDFTLFDNALQIIGQHTGWDCFGVLPYLPELRSLPAEDSVALERRVGNAAPGNLRIIVPVLPRIANFDDLDPLAGEPGIDMIFVRPGERFPGSADLVILPGTKSTIADLAAFREQGWETDLRRHVANGGRVIGICGGFQMLGRRIADPLGIEGVPGEVDGLGLLDVETAIVEEKIIRNAQPVLAAMAIPLSGYEIHMGRTSGPDCQRPMIMIAGRPDGAVSENGRIAGCYLHGLFASDAYRSWLLGELGCPGAATSHTGRLDTALDALAEAIENRLAVDTMLDLARSAE